MSDQILTFADELKSELKKLKSQYQQVKEIDYIYKQFKKLIGMIKQLHKSKQKIPDFFQSLHGTTIDMRMKLLADLGKQQTKRKKMENQYEKLFIELKNQIDNKNKKIFDLQKRCLPLRMSKSSDKNAANKIQFQQKQINDLKEQCHKLINSNKDLAAKLDKKMQSQKLLSQQINRRQNENKKNRYNRRLSPSPDRFMDYTQSKTVYDNVLGSFSQIPNQRNLTQLDKTYSQQQTDRKVKSVYAPNQNIKIADQLWRLLYIQASSIEQFLINAQ